MMQILSISIFNNSGKRRDIEFHPGRLNIITGATKTGKTAIIGILDYCLGRNEYVVPPGKIRENVAWYVIKVQLNGFQAVIGRPAPTGTTTSDVFLRVEKNVRIPEYAELKRTTGSDQLISFLDEQLGLADYEHIPPEGRTRLPLKVNMKHARFLLFQPQYRIMAPDLMFYRQQEDFVPQAIRDSLPYFLGATQDEQFSKLQELRLVRRELKLLERRIADEEAISGRDASRTIALVEQAKNVGLLSEGANTFEGALSLLVELQNWTPQSEEVATISRLEPLRKDREALLAEFQSVQDEIAAARSFRVAQDDYTSELSEQASRLASIQLYKHESKGNTCPLCDSDLSANMPSVEMVKQSIDDITSRIGSAFSQKPRLTEFVAEREASLSKLRQSLIANRGAMEAIVEQEDKIRQERDRLAEQARVVGRAGLFLESVSLSGPQSELRTNQKKLEAKVNRLEAELADDTVEDRMASILRLMSKWMTDWAIELEFEHSAWPLGFDLRHLTAVSYQEDRPERMSDLGGGTNWLICHLVTHLALQKWFITKKRPVPSFLIFDQPSQAYFPRERPFEGRLEELGDPERQGVERIFRFLYDITAELAPDLQIIVTDHADIAEDWFRESVIQNWHDGDALVPSEWYS